MRAEEVLVAGVIRMRDQGDTGGQQLGAGRLDLHGGAVRPVEADAVVGGGHLLVFELGLGNGGAEGDVPQRRCVGLVGLTAGEVAQECTLSHPLRVIADGAVALVPVDAQTERPPDVLELLLVFRRELLAQLDEVAA